MGALAIETVAYRIRPGRVEDLGYVIGTYLHGFHSALAVRRVHPDEYRGRVRQQIVAILERPAARLYVACDLEDDGVIIGFALLEGPCVHWVDVRDTWRGEGIARALLESHDTPTDRYSAWVVGLHAGKLPDTWAYDPFAAVWPNWADTAPPRRQTHRRQRARSQSE